MPNLKRSLTGTITIMGREMPVNWDGSVLSIMQITDEKVAVTLLTLLERAASNALDKARAGKAEEAGVPPEVLAQEPKAPQASPASPAPIEAPVPSPEPEIPAASASGTSEEIVDTPLVGDPLAGTISEGKAEDLAEADKKRRIAERTAKAVATRKRNADAKRAKEAAALDVKRAEDEARQGELELPQEEGDPLISESLEPEGPTDAGDFSGIPEGLDPPEASTPPPPPPPAAKVNGSAKTVPPELAAERTIRRVLIYLRDQEGLSTYEEYLARCKEIKPQVNILGRVTNMDDKVRRAMSMMD